MTMNVKQLFLLSTLCLTMGTTQAPAQGFLNKLKNKGAKLVKQAMPDPVKEVVNTVEETEGAASRTRNRVESKVRNRTSGASTRRTRTQAGSSMAGGGVTLSSKKKEITIKLCRGLGPSTCYGRKTRVHRCLLHALSKTAGTGRSHSSTTWTMPASWLKQTC